MVWSLKNPVATPGIDPGTVRLVAQRLNHYATPGPGSTEYFSIFTPIVMLLLQPNIIYWHLSKWVLRRVTKPSLFCLICTCVMIHSYPIHSHSSSSIRFSPVLLDLPSGHLFDIPIFMLWKGSHHRQCLVFIQNCTFNLDCPTFSDSAFRHEATFCSWFLQYFFLSNTSQKFYLYCLQSAQYRNRRIINLHSSKHKHAYIVHVVRLPTYCFHIFWKLVWTAKLLPLLLLSLARNICAPESHSNLAPSRIYLHADNGWNFKIKPPKPENIAKAYYGE